MTNCLHCGVLFDESLTWGGASRTSGLPRKFCTMQCKFKKNNTRERQRRYRLKSSYGLTEVDYECLLSEQESCCKICGKEDQPTPLGRTGAAWRLHVDHDHKTGEVRGLLCNNCNVGISRFEDNPDLLRLAAKYLEDR